MNNNKNQEFVLSRRPEGQHDLKDTWKLQDAEYPKISTKGEFIAETLLLSVDPYLSSGIKVSALGGNVSPLGTVQCSFGLFRVLESNNDNYPVDALVVSARVPWRKFNKFDEGDDKNTDFKISPTKVFKKGTEDYAMLERLGLGASLGALGMPSQTAYYGAKDVGKFQPDDILVVSGAAGAVGSVVGQVAKKVLKVKKVIGVAGGKKKCDYLVNELGYDAAIDYKEYNTKEKVAARLQELAGGPITTYFDNTGGFVTDAIFDVIARHGRILVCGQISSYNKDEKEANTYPNYLAKTIYKSLTILGFLVGDFSHKNDKEFFVDFPKWLEQGLIKTNETNVEGFENLPRAYEMLYTGENIGKVIVKV